jgi:hypothetical protein
MLTLKSSVVNAMKTKSSKRKSIRRKEKRTPCSKTTMNTIRNLTRRERSQSTTNQGELDWQTKASTNGGTTRHQIIPALFLKLKYQSSWTQVRLSAIYSLTTCVSRSRVALPKWSTQKRFLSKSQRYRGHRQQVCSASPCRSKI